MLVSVQEDRDADGRADRWEAYSGGGLTTLELDTTGAGQPTRRLRYAGDQVWSSRSSKALTLRRGPSGP